MASTKLFLIFVLLVSLSITSVISLSERDAVSNQEDESYAIATSDQGSSMNHVDDLAKARGLKALVDVRKVFENKAVSKSTSTKSLKKDKKKKKKKKKSKEIELEVGVFVGIIIGSALSGAVTLALVLLLVFLYYDMLYDIIDMLETKKAQMN